MKKNKSILFTFLLLFIISFLIIIPSNVVYALDYVECGSASGIPKPIPQMTTIAYTLLMVGVPIVLVTTAIISLLKAVASSNEEKIIKSKEKLFKKFALAGMVFLTAGVVQFTITKVTSTESDKESVVDCLSCFLYFTNCGGSDTGNDVENKTYTDPYINVKQAPSSRAGLGKALTKEQVEEALKQMDHTPTYEELFEIAQKVYNMPEDVFQVVFGWTLGEGYDSAPNDYGSVDHYLGYLCDCIGVNFYMGYDIKDAGSLAAKIGGYDKSGYYSLDRMKSRSLNAKNNPKSVEAGKFKGMYLALVYPNENIHDCDGVSNYAPYGGVVYYSSGPYDGYQINTWSLWYDGIKPWVSNLSKR